MTNLSGYIYLLLTIILGIVSNGFLKSTNGFTNIVPTIFCIVTIIMAIFFMAKAMNIIPVGITYASFAGLCIIATTIVGIYKFNQMPDLYTIVGLTLIISGVIIVNLLGKTG